MSNEGSFLHLILTRFNCSNSRSPNDREIPIRSRPGWMEERFELFERYCLPSVLAQTNQNFEWRIYFDRHTSPEHLERARRGIAGRDNIRLVLCDIYGSETAQEDLARDLPESLEWLVTTRFDNDDALHREFVERLHGEIRPGTMESLNFPLGVVYGQGKTYLSRQESNAFISLSEPFVPDFRTVLAIRHEKMDSVAPVRNIDGGPAWMQVVHDRNVSNKLRGRRLPCARLLEGFEKVDLGPAMGRKDYSLGIVFENLTFTTGRDVRDRLARAVRKLLE
ncbi:glycosyltransferase [Rhodoblastus sp.]|uniref:glycosyltransferase n=1 Tax=Rhodoblastus sp. TaxID=1962975 RepID=UPI003F9E087B